MLLLLLPCSDIIHYANRKLKVYKGNLSKFVEAVPEAQSYYALEATEQVGANIGYVHMQYWPATF
jgi:ATPase subunit of ABC transporter with duplicated ATPase domains